MSWKQNNKTPSEVGLAHTIRSELVDLSSVSPASPSIYVGYFSWPIYVLGPGKRVGLWLQGCTLNCPGCMSQHLFAQRPENTTSVATLLEELRPGLQSCEGITISGGEPFEQPQALCALLECLHAGFPNVDVMVYSGFTIEEIWQNEARRAALCGIDVLIDGRFEVKASNRKIWRGSDNQRLLLLSERAQKYAAFCEAEALGKRALQIEKIASGELRLYGIPERGVLRKMEEKMRARNASV